MLSLANTTLSLPEPAHYVAIVNDHAGMGGEDGQGAAPTLATALQEEFGRDRFSIVATDEDPERRLDGIVAAITAAKPTTDHPVEVVGIGGDGTFNDTVLGTLTSIFPHLSEILRGDPEAAAARMAASGLRLATLGTGGACDNAKLTGAPHGRPIALGEAAAYLREPHYDGLNLGVAQLRGLPFPLLITHSFSMGKVVAPAFQDTVGLLGNGARRARQFASYQHLFRLLTGQTEAVFVHLRDTAGTVQRIPLAEVMAGTVIRTDGHYAVTGVPPQGMAVKILPDEAWWRMLLNLAEIAPRGTFTPWARRLGPDSRMLFLPQDLQIVLGPGQELIFDFVDVSGWHLNLPSQSNGDFSGASYGVTLRGLPSFPFIHVRPGSILADARAHRGSNALPAPNQVRGQRGLPG